MAKKDFKPAAEAFISTPAQQPATAEGFQIPAGMQLIPEYRSERMQLLVQPRIKQGMILAAKREGISTNELANRLFAEYLGIDA